MSKLGVEWGGRGVEWGGRGVEWGGRGCAIRGCAIRGCSDSRLRDPLTQSSSAVFDEDPRPGRGTRRFGRLDPMVKRRLAYDGALEPPIMSTRTEADQAAGPISSRCTC